MSELGKRLYLNTNTLTPLIKKMKDKGLVKKTRSDEDERTVFITITPKAKDLRKKAKTVPSELLQSLQMSEEDIETVREIMWRFLSNFDFNSPDNN